MVYKSIRFCLTVAALYAAGAGGAWAETINCDGGGAVGSGAGKITTVPYVISTPGVYCVTQKISSNLASGAAITVNANNVVIDLNDFAIGNLQAGATTQAFGIYALDRQNIYVRNGTLRGFFSAVALLHGTSNLSSGHRVEGITTDTSYMSGIWVQGPFARVKGNHIMNTRGDPTTYLSAYGILVSAGAAPSGGPALVSNNLVLDTDCINSCVSGSTAYGISVQGSPGSVISGNRVMNETPATATASYAIFVSKSNGGATSSNVFVQNNMFANWQNGIYFNPAAPAASGDLRFNGALGVTTPYTGGNNITNGGVNYTDSSTPATVYGIFGNVTGTTSVVSMALSGTASATTTTDALGGGFFTFPGLVNGNYTITPSLSGYSFNPSSALVTISGASISQNFAASVVGPPPYTISGTVTGPTIAGVNILLTGSGSAATTTDASGNFSFGGLQAGNYTVTPTLAGLTFSPSSATLAVTNNIAQNFTDSAAITGTTSNISGSVSYAGTAPGGIFIALLYANCSCNQAVGGTWIAAPGTYTIRGVLPGSYTVVAYKDAAGSNALNAIDPIGSASVGAVSAGVDVTGVTVNLTDQVALTAAAPTAGPSVVPVSGAAGIFWGTNKAASAISGITTEAAKGYKVYWGTDSAATNGGSAIVTARGTNNNAVYFLTGLTNGAAYYFKVTALGTTNESTASPVTGPITIGAATGANTVSGTVTMPPAYPVPGYILVGLSSTAGSGIYFATVPVPTVASTVAYSISGVPVGTYNPVAIYATGSTAIGATGVYLAGNAGGYSAPVTVSGNTSNVNVAFPTAGARAEVSNDHGSNGVPGGDYYNLFFNIWRNNQVPVAAAVISGPNIAVPTDLGISPGKQGQFNSQAFGLGPTAPLVGDAYQLQLTYSDGSTAILPVAVTGVLDSFAGSLAAPGATARTTPTFSWTAPTVSPPAQYGYEITVTGGTGGWRYPQNIDSGMPSSQNSVLYDVDATASAPALTAGVAYTWSITVKDSTNHNQATYYTTYTP